MRRETAPLPSLPPTLLPPYRCCAVSTRSLKGGAGQKHPTRRACDICGWVYKKDGTKAHNYLVKKHDRREIDK